MLPKDHEISSVSGETILKKDEDFDILCFDINFDGFLATNVHELANELTNHTTTIDS